MMLCLSSQAEEFLCTQSTVQLLLIRSSLWGVHIIWSLESSWYLQNYFKYVKYEYFELSCFKIGLWGTASRLAIKEKIRVKPKLFRLLLGCYLPSLPERFLALVFHSDWSEAEMCRAHGVAVPWMGRGVGGVFSCPPYLAFNFQHSQILAKKNQFLGKMEQMLVSPPPCCCVMQR